MGFRFNRRITIIPGVHLNLGMGGASVSVGPRGASLNIGRKGTHATLSVPGTGLSYRTKIGASTSATSSRDRAGRGQEREALLEALDQEVEDARHSLELVHADTPPLPASPIFGLPKPAPSDVAALMAWRAAKANFENGRPLGNEPTALLVEIALSRLAWPRPAEVDFRIDDHGVGLTIDVDLPELEDMPDTEPVVDRRAVQIVNREIPTRRRADLYATHVAGIAFRLLGALFATLPGVERISLSAYTSRSTGGAGTRDDYVAVGTVHLRDWRRIDLSNPAAIDVEDAVRRLGIRMERSGRGLLMTLDPCF